MREIKWCLVLCVYLFANARAIEVESFETDEETRGNLRKVSDYFMVGEDSKIKLICTAKVRNTLIEVINTRITRLTVSLLI